MLSHASASGRFTIIGVYDSCITVTDNAKRTEVSNGVDRHAEPVLIDREEPHFAGAKCDFGETKLAVRVVCAKQVCHRRCALATLYANDEILPRSNGNIPDVADRQ